MLLRRLPLTDMPQEKTAEVKPFEAGDTFTQNKRCFLSTSLMHAPSSGTVKVRNQTILNL